MPPDAESRRLKTLVARMRAGSHDAAWEILQMFEPHVRAVVRRHLRGPMRVYADSDDFLQAAWASLLRITPQLHEFDHPEQLVALLARIAQNKVIDEHRRMTRAAKRDIRRNRPLEDAADQQLAGRLPSPSQLAVARERWDQLVASLTPQHRQIVQRRLAGNTYEEIAHQLGIHERTARRVLVRLLEQQRSSEFGPGRPLRRMG